MRIALFAVMLACSGPFQVDGQSGSCTGEDRWKVKTMADPDSSKVQQAVPTVATLAQLIALTRPAVVGKDTPRTGSTETTVYQLSATLVIYGREDDQDYHLVLQDEQEQTMIAEIPDPACAAGSAVLSEIVSARQAFDSHYKVDGDKHATKVPVTVTGVGFFDLEHGTGQLGHADNNIELHPVLAIQFNGQEPSDFKVPTAASAAGENRMAAMNAPSLGLMWWVIALGMTIFYIVAIRGTVGTLTRSHNWQLADALREHDGKPSSSRMIAFLGLLILMVLYMGIGYVAIWRLLNNQDLPNVNTFLLTGLSLFAPYAFNQIKQMAVGAPPGFANGRSAPKVVAVAPNSLVANVSTQLTVTGVGFDPKAAVSVTTSTATLTLSSVMVSATQIQFTVTMPSFATPYVAVLHVLNPDGGEAMSSFQVS